jgi:hypothetical protein
MTTLVMIWVVELLLVTVSMSGLSPTKTPSGANVNVVGEKLMGGGAAPSVTTTLVAGVLPTAFFTTIEKV